MKRTIKRWTLGAAFVAVLGVLASCASKPEQVQNQANATAEKTTIKIGYLPLTHAAPLYLEKQLEEQNAQGFKNFRLELVKFGSWPDLIDALNAGQVDGASVLVEAAMKARGMGIPIKAVALGHRDGNAIITTPDIKKPADLKGKTFAIPHKFSSHNILLFEMLKQAGLSEKDVNIVEMPPAEMPAALARKRVAGYSVAEPFGAQSVVLGNGKMLLQSEDLWKNSICCVLVLREALLKDNAVATQEFIDEYAAAGKRAETKDAKVRSDFQKYMKVDDKVLDLSLKWISYNDLKLDQASYKQLVDYLTEMKLGDNLPSYEDFVDPTFLDKTKSDEAK